MRITSLGLTTSWGEMNIIKKMRVAMCSQRHCLAVGKGSRRLSASGAFCKRQTVCWATLNSFGTSVVEGMLVHAHHSDGILGVEHLLGLKTRSAMLLPHGG